MSIVSRVWSIPVFAALMAASLTAQDRSASSPAATDPNVEKRSNEWSILASNLEQRIARLLPCDPRVRSSIDEVSRASELRMAALTAYWQAASTKSKAQIETLRGLIDDQDPASAEEKTERAHMDVEQTGITAQITALRESAKRMPSLASAQRSLDALSDGTQKLSAQALDREISTGQLASELDELLTASRARQSAIENELRALANENARWNAFYLARAARAQTECAIINGPAPAVAPAPARRPAAAGKKK